jgi:hypothetical protein
MESTDQKTADTQIWQTTTIIQTESNLDEVPDAVLCEELLVAKRHMGHSRLLEHIYKQMHLREKQTSRSVRMHHVKDGQDSYKFECVRADGMN